MSESIEEKEVITLEQQQAMLEMDWDDIENLPEFVDVPAGMWLMDVEKAGIKETDDSVKINILLKARECLENVEEMDEETRQKVEEAIGNFMGQNYQASHLEFFKKDYKQVNSVLRCRSVPEILDQLEGKTLAVSVSYYTPKAKPGKAAGTKPFAQYSNITLVDGDGAVG